MGAVVDNKRAIKIARFLMMASTMTGALALATAARAGDEPLYQPIPEWVDKSEADKQLASATSVKSGIVVLDKQSRISKGNVTSYVDFVYNIDSPEMMAQAGMLNGSWNPSLGDFIVHRVEILRGTDKIDALAGGRKFEVLRREEALSRLQLTGILTAMFQVDGLRIGDRVRFSATQSRKDSATGDFGEIAVPLVAKPAQIHFARSSVAWPGDENLKWKISGKDVVSNFVKSSGGKDNVLTIQEPVPTQPESPKMAPLRYTKMPLVEVTGFADWKQVSRTNAPLYKTDGLIAAGSDLATEADKIAKATKDPKHRAAMALDLVQREVRYLFNGMGNGNYVPQTPAQTWELRYGDCKAKTLLLLALLHKLDVQAEPALVSATTKDLVSERLPAFGAFDHIIVKAKIDGQTYWLDGTRNGDQLADLENVPDFRYALPSTLEGADLEQIAFRPKARPDSEYELTIDLSNGFALPAPIKVRQALRGETAAVFRMAQGMVDEEKVKEGVSITLQPNDRSHIVDSRLTVDEKAGTAVLEGEGLMTISVANDNEMRKFSLHDVVVSYVPDASRGKAEWANIPFAAPTDEYIKRKIRIVLPNGGKGLTVENADGYQTDLGGYQMSRVVTQKAGIVEVDEVTRLSNWEIPFDKFLADKGKLTQMEANPPKIVLAADYLPEWKERKLARQSGKISSIVKIYDAAVLSNKEDTHALGNRATFYEGIKDYPKAIADLTRMIEMEPVADNYSWRAWLHYHDGDLKQGEADARKALSLESSHQKALGNLMLILERAERYDEALALTDQMKANGESDIVVASQRADLLDTAGRSEEAIRVLEEINSKKPGNPIILNGLCWRKGRNEIDLAGALKECTKAIELAEQPAAILDSRGLVYYRMKRYDEALADYNAALRMSPGLVSSLFMRGLTKIAMGNKASAADDIAAATEIDPHKIREFAKVGLKP